MYLSLNVDPTLYSLYRARTTAITFAKSSVLSTNFAAKLLAVRLLFLAAVVAKKLGDFSCIGLLPFGFHALL